MKILSRLLVIFLTVLIVAIYNFFVTPYEDAINSELCSKTELPVIMYHSFLKDSNSHGKFVISPEQFEKDISYILEKGYTPISIKELLLYSEGKGTLPDKPIMITIDDGYYNNYLYIFPIIKQYGVKVIIAPIVKYSELYSAHDENNAYYSHITWQQGREMLTSGLVEFQNHTYDMHYIDSGRKGIKKLKSESEENYQKILFADLYKAHNLMKENLGFTPHSIAFPFGYYSKEAEPILKELGYDISFSSTEGINNISVGSTLHQLKRYNRPHGKASADFFKGILK